MRPDRPAPELEEIPEQECLELLSRSTLGRIGVCVDGRPRVFPVNYGLRAGVVVFRTAPGTKLSYAADSPVAFEIDGFDGSTGVGWSVLVQGIARDTTGALDDFSWAARGTTVHPLAPGEKSHRVAIDPVEITGRRFRLDAQ